VAAHYFFPPARAYHLNRCLYAIKSDSEFRQRFLQDKDRAMGEIGLDEEARAALAAFDRDRLVGLGAHPYLVFMAGLRVRMQGEPSSFERF
jgi:hypothetical protein